MRPYVSTLMEGVVLYLLKILRSIEEGSVVGEFTIGEEIRHSGV